MRDHRSMEPQPGPQPAAERVADGLRKRIIEGRLAAGRPLRETTLAAEFEVSRNTVREGFRLLVLDIYRGRRTIEPLGLALGLLIFAGAFNGLILPLGLGLLRWVAARRSDLLGGYRYPRWLTVVGSAAWLITVYLGARSLTDLGKLF
jgi:hypothetical protein